MEATTVAAAMSTLLPKLGSLLQEQYKLRKGVKQDIAFLKKELSKLQDAVFYASDMGLLHWADDYWRKLRELSNDIEDSADQLMIRAGPKPGLELLRDRGLIDKCKDLLAEVKTRDKIAKQIHNIKPQLKKVRERYPTEGKLKSSSASSVPIQASEPSAKVSTVTLEDAGSSSLVGLDRPRDELIAKLQLMQMEAEEPELAARLKVVSIVGAGGLGKTTLAHEVYKKTQTYFDRRAWVSVSRNPNMENILMGILRQVEDPRSSGAADGNDERDLIRRIKGSLQGKRYLLVLDDIWSTRTWEVIKLALPLDSCGGRVITTTRVEAVAASCCSDWNGYIYQVIPLSSKDSWILFRRRIIGSTGCFPSDLVDISEYILERCSGVPLAIITMSCLLANKQPQEDVYKYISRTPGGTEGMRDILLLSYNDLPHHLKACLLYLGIFPENYPINCHHIIRCWIAEGLISENHQRTPEEVGESYLNEFTNRCMIQPVRDSYGGKPESFLIHSMMLELIKSKINEDNFVTLSNNEEPLPVLRSKIRRLSIININEDRDIPTSMNISHIRSLHIFSGLGMKLTFKRLRFLRVLDLEGCKDLNNHTIEMIPGLLNLRYLSIRDIHTGELPNQIKQQQQGIQLNSSCYLNSIPEWFTSLPSLRYVSIDIEEVKNEDLQLLSKLYLLHYLSLSSKIVPTEKLVICSNGFPALREFHLQSVRADLTFEPKAMEKLEILLLSIHVLPDGKCGFSTIISQFCNLKKIDIRIYGEDAAAYQLFKATDVAIRRAADEHPKHPLANIIALGNLISYAVEEGKENEQEMRNLIDYAVKEGKEMEQEMELMELD